MTDAGSPDRSVEDEGLIRSEERLAVTTRRVPIGRAVLRKVVVVEQRTITVDVAHEEVVLEHLELDEDDPVSDDEPRGSHLALPDVVLYEEEVVVTKRLVPTERIRVEVATVREERRVTEDLRREHIDVVPDPADD